MVYTSDRPQLTPSREELQQRVPGWGVDLDPANRPAVPREQWQPTGAHWTLPASQPEEWPRERSIEHQMLTPVFGTSCPPKGLSGMIRRYAYRRFSEGRATHWLLLIAADRVDSLESDLRSMVRGRPDNPITETGIRSEFTHHGLRSRFGQKRADLNHMWLDPVIVAAPWALRAGLVYAVARAVLRRWRSRTGVSG